MNITPDQQLTIKSWVEERDGFLNTLAQLRSEEELLSRRVNELGVSYSTILDSIHSGEARVALLHQEEEFLKNSLSKEVVEKQLEKTDLENSLFTLRNEYNELQSKKDLLLTDFDALIPVYERIAFQIGALNTTVDKVVTINRDNIIEVNGMVDKLKKTLLINQE